MTKAFGERRRAAFLRAVAETGNQTIAAARAKVSRSWVTLHQSSDPGFRAAIEAAVAEARARLASGEAMAPGEGWGWQDGAELVVRGTNGRRVQVARARLKQWDPGAEALFLSTLSATCNVKAACAAVELSAASAYNHRKRWPGFAARWTAAVEEGCVRLEAELLEHGANLFSDEATAEMRPIPKMTVAEALQMLSMHKRETRAARNGGGGQRWRRPPDRPLEELRAEILRKVEIIRRRDRMEPGPFAHLADGAGRVWRGREPG